MGMAIDLPRGMQSCAYEQDYDQLAQSIQKYLHAGDRVS